LNTTRPTTERHIPGIAASRHFIKEQALFIRIIPRNTEIGLDGIFVVEVLRRLHDTHRGVIENPIVRRMKAGKGTKSASKIQINSPVVFNKASLRLPA
jgi:hypothetical protein